MTISSQPYVPRSVHNFQQNLSFSEGSFPMSVGGPTRHHMSGIPQMYPPHDQSLLSATSQIYAPSQ